MRRFALLLSTIAFVAVTGIAALCGDGRTDGDGGSAAATATPAGGTGSVDPTRRVPAPIDDAEIIVRESFPPQYAVRIVSGLPSGCARFDAYETVRAGETITITVTNSVPAARDAICTAIYGRHEGTVELGTDFVAGTQYSVNVNDRALTFTAQ